MHPLGRKSLNAFKAFNQSAASRELDGLFERYFHVGPAHESFEAGLRVAQAMRQAAAVKPSHVLTHTLGDGPGQPLDRMNIRLFLGHMLPREDSRKYISFFTTCLSMDAGRIEYRIRPLPGQWSVHADERHWQRLGRSLDYEHENFAVAVPFVLALARVLEPRVARSPERQIPFVVPHRDGLFMGIARDKSDPDDFLWRSRIYLRAGEKDLEPIQWLRMEWIPSIDLEIRTFVAKSQLGPGQARLHQKLLPFLEEPRVVILSGGIDLYSCGLDKNDFCTPEHRQLPGVWRELNDLIASPLWNANVRMPSPIFRPGMRMG